MTDLQAWLTAFTLPNGAYAILLVVAFAVIAAQLIHALRAVRRLKRRVQDVEAAWYMINDAYSHVLSVCEGKTLMLADTEAETKIDQRGQVAL